MRTIDSDKRKQVFTAAVKLVHDVGELSSALFALFRPNKIKCSGVVINNQAVNSANLDQPVENYHGPVPISKVLELWHEMETWDLLNSQSRRKNQLLTGLFGWFRRFSYKFFPIR
jgi:hypothetical protein